MKENEENISSQFASSLSKRGSTGKLRIWGKLIVLFEPFNYVVPKLCLDWARSLAFFKGKCRLLKLFNHLSPCEGAKVATIFCGWTK